MADAVVDLVESGETMRAAGLEIVDVVMETQAVLIANPHSKHRDLVDIIRRRITGVLTAEKHVMIEYNIERSLLHEASLITPGKKSPTVSSLEDPNWLAVKAMILRSEASNKLDQLEALGATAILITSLENCRV